MDEAHRTFLRLGERHLAGGVLIKKGLCLRLEGQPADAVPVLRQALELVDGSRDPKLAASARQNLMDALVDAGRLAEAGQVLLESDLRQAFADDPQSLLRLRWVEAKLLALRGRLADATRVLSEVRAGFRSYHLEYVAAVAGADETALLLKQGLKEAHLLATDLWRTFSRLGIHEEAERLSSSWRSPAAGAWPLRSWPSASAAFSAAPHTTTVCGSTRKASCAAERRPTVRWRGPTACWRPPTAKRRPPIARSRPPTALPTAPAWG